MPRKSVESKILAHLGHDVGPPPPPAHLSAAERDVWIAALTDVPAGHLRAADLQLLVEYCRSIAELERMWARVAKMRDGDERDLQLERVQKLQNAAARLATKVRLCASANSRIETGSNKRNLDRKVKPWLAS
jgi:hypothetical protein